MTKDYKLVALYFFIFECNITVLRELNQRNTNNCCPEFTDVEVLTVYLWGLIHYQGNKKAIYQFTKDYWHSWFPALPTYKCFNERVNKLMNSQRVLIELILERLLLEDSLFRNLCIDSMPIVTCKGVRSGKVAPDLCDKSFNSSKNMWYWGVKLHILGYLRANKLPLPDQIEISNASAHDIKIAKYMLNSKENCNISADKAYNDAEWHSDLLENQGVNLITPEKKEKNKELTQEQIANNKLKSAVRQPIESFFAWIQRKTGIQDAHLVRSEVGLKTHIWGRIAAVLCCELLDVLNYNLV